MNPTPSGLRILSDLARAAGAQMIDSRLELPASVGTGFMQHLAPEPGLRLVIHQCTLRQELTLKRPPDLTQPETLYLSFNAFGQAPSAAAPPLSSVQITSSDIGITTVLPANTPFSAVSIALEKALLRRWLNVPDEDLPTILTARHPVLLDTLLTPEIQAALADFITPNPAAFLAPFFYKIRTQELLYWLFRELATRAVAPVRPLHTADAEKIFQVRTALLASLSAPPSVPALALAAGLSETRLKQLFRQVFGTSVYEYFQQARMAEARRLLPQLSVAEVGYRLGFTNMSHFARLFEKHHGLTPKKYQNSSANF